MLKQQAQKQRESREAGRKGERWIKAKRRRESERGGQESRVLGRGKEEVRGKQKGT